MLVPVGWKVEGGAFYFPEQFFKAMPSQEITLTSPEGVMLRVDPEFMAVDNFPPAYLGMQRSAEGSSDGGTPVIYYPGDLAGWKTTFRSSANRGNGEASLVSHGSGARPVGRAHAGLTARRQA